jgi:hypothetical protein
MAALADMSLTDAASVAHVFKHKNHNGKDFIWADSTAGLTSLSAPVISMHVLPSKDKTLERYRIKVSLPALETLTSSAASGYQAAPRVAYSLNYTGDYVIPSRATLAQRKDLTAFPTHVHLQGQFTDTLWYGNLPF